ncbi:MAG: heavy metal-associated domain-containing protein [Bacteroidetes bacterium]|nr:heavy metal-associated domain-containing protein [Bacteroidota bacterium]
MKTKIDLKVFFLTIILVSFIISGSFAEDKKNTEIKIKTSAVCGMCKDRIEQGMAYEKGIKDVSLDVDTKIATIKYNSSKTTPGEIRNAISKLGYDADSIPADKTAYDKLPPCCKKDAKKHN